MLNCPMTPPKSWLVGLIVKILSFTSHAPIGAIIFTIILPENLIISLGQDGYTEQEIQGLW